MTTISENQKKPARKNLEAQPWKLHQLSDEQRRSLANWCDYEDGGFASPPSVSNGSGEIVEMTWRRTRFSRRETLMVGTHHFAMKRSGEYRYVPYSAIQKLMQLKILGFVDVQDEDERG